MDLVKNLYESYEFLVGLLDVTATKAGQLIVCFRLGQQFRQRVLMMLQVLDRSWLLLLLLDLFSGCHLAEQLLPIGQQLLQQLRMLQWRLFARHCWTLCTIQLHLKIICAKEHRTRWLNVPRNGIELEHGGFVIAQPAGVGSCLENDVTVWHKFIGIPCIGSVAALQLPVQEKVAAKTLRYGDATEQTARSARVCHHGIQQRLPSASVEDCCLGIVVDRETRSGIILDHEIGHIVMIEVTWHNGANAFAGRECIVPEHAIVASIEGKDGAIESCHDHVGDAVAIEIGEHSWHHETRSRLLVQRCEMLLAGVRHQGEQTQTVYATGCILATGDHQQQIRAVGKRQLLNGHKHFLAMWRRYGAYNLASPARDELYVASLRFLALLEMCSNYLGHRIPIQVAQHIDRIEIHDNGRIRLHFQLVECPNHMTGASIDGENHLEKIQH